MSVEERFSVRWIEGDIEKVIKMRLIAKKVMSKSNFLYQNIYYSDIYSDIKATNIYSDIKATNNHSKLFVDEQDDNPTDILNRLGLSSNASLLTKLRQLNNADCLEQALNLSSK